MPRLALVASCRLRPGMARCRSPGPSGTPSTTPTPPPASCHRTSALLASWVSPPSQHGRRPTGNNRHGWRSPLSKRLAGCGPRASDRLRHAVACPRDPEPGSGGRRIWSPTVLDPLVGLPGCRTCGTGARPDNQHVNEELHMRRRHGQTGPGDNQRQQTRERQQVDWQHPGDASILAQLWSTS